MEEQRNQEEKAAEEKAARLALQREQKEAAHAAREARKAVVRQEREQKEAEERAVLQKQDEKFMRAAMKQAEKAAALGEVPIGCVIVCDGKIIGRGYNRRNTDKNTLSHAEITAINKASRKLSDWRLENCTLYVTLEPCQMCAGAIVQARVSEVVMGCMNPKAGCAGSILNLLEMKEFNHRVNVRRGVLEEECSLMLKHFFTDLRKRLKTEKQLTKAAKNSILK